MLQIKHEQGGSMKLVIVLVGGLVLFTSCDGREAPKAPAVFTERRDAVRQSTATREVGEECDLGGPASCRTSICGKTGLEREHGSFCTTECATDADCAGPQWSCKTVMPGPRGKLCIAPAGWVSRAVGVRP